MIEVIGKAHISAMDIVGHDNRRKSMTIHAGQKTPQLQWLKTTEWITVEKPIYGLRRPGTWGEERL
jgi:hypothetical protein